MLAPNAPLRSAVTALAGAEPAQAGVEAPAAAVAVPATTAPSASPALAEEPLHRRAARYAWALLLARIYEVFPLLCPKYGAEMRIIAFITEAPALRQILAQLGEPTTPPPLAPARDPPLWEMADAGQGEHDPQAQPVPDYEVDQRVAW